MESLFFLACKDSEKLRFKLSLDSDFRFNLNIGKDQYQYHPKHGRWQAIKRCQVTKAMTSNAKRSKLTNSHDYDNCSIFYLYTSENIFICNFNPCILHKTHKFSFLQT